MGKGKGDSRSKRIIVVRMFGGVVIFLFVCVVKLGFCCLCCWGLEIDFAGVWYNY